MLLQQKLSQKLGKKKQQFLNLCIHIISNAVWKPYRYTHPTTKKYVTRYFLRHGFFISELDVAKFIVQSDSHWRDIMKMQHRFLQSIEYMIERKSLSTDSFEPNTYAKMFKNLSGSIESIEDWTDSSFKIEFPNSNKCAVIFFGKIKHISGIINHFVTLDNMYSEILSLVPKCFAKISNTHQIENLTNYDSITSTIFLKVHEIHNIFIDVLKQNSYEIVIDEWVYDILYAILKYSLNFYKSSVSLKLIDEYFLTVQHIFTSFEQTNGPVLDTDHIYHRIKIVCKSDLLWRAEIQLNALNRFNEISSSL
jgi:hypothetical protein